MNIEKYKLFWRDILLGELNETHWDMRNSGIIGINPLIFSEKENSQMLEKFINHSIKMDEFLEEGDMDNYHKMCSEEENYAELIDSKEWYLLTNDTKKIQILCPIFHNKNEITWQKILIPE